MSNKRTTTAEIVDDLKTCSDMDNASCLFCWRYSSGTRDAHCVGTLMIDAAERLESLQNAMNRLGKFGKLFMDYNGCPRGPMGRMAGVSLVDEALSMPEIVDVDGGRWIPVQADVLRELCEQAKSVNGAPVQHGHWEWYEEWSESNPDHYSELEDAGWRCSQCKVGLGDYISDRVREAVYADNMLEMPNVEFCPHCGAKMDEEDNDG